MKEIDELVSKAKQDKDVLALMVFGSYARGEDHRDIDVCMVLSDGTDNRTMSEKRLSYLSENNLDIQIFQQLPLYIRIRILKEGKIIFCRDMPKLYDIAIRTVRDYGYFEPIYEGYLKAVEHG